MKPRNWEFWSGKFATTVLLLATFLLAFSRSDAANENAVIHIQQAKFIISNATTVPPPTADWESVTLPHHVPKPTYAELIPYWYKVTFNVEKIGEPLWVLFPKLPSGGDVYVNGNLIGRKPWSNEHIQVRWYMPAMWLIPPTTIHAGKNEIEVFYVIRDPFTSFGEIDIGPEKIQHNTFDRLLFWEDTTADISASLCLLAGMFILVFWMRRPQEKLYGLFGVCALFWGLRTFLLREPIVSTEHFLMWRLAYYFCTAGFIVLISIFMRKFSNRDNSFYNTLFIAYWLFGCTAFAIFGLPIRHFLEAYWLTGFLPLNLYAVFGILTYAVRQRTHHAVFMGLAILVALGLSVHDLAVQEAWVDWPEIYLMHLGIPAFLVVMLWMLMDRFLNTLEQVESMNEQLELRVAARETELKQSYEQLRKLERSHAASEERHRIVQDMHDGVGTQLLSTLMVAQGSELSQKTLVGLLQECLDDMRLVIDSLTPDDRDLLPVLGNFRFRMETRFRAIGLDFEWTNHEMPDSLELDPDVGLQVLRILQEALGNVLKHAQAKQVTVDLFFDPKSLRVRITDNGRGFQENPNSAGRGLSNMRNRAKKIGAKFDIRPLSPGTEIELEVALEVALDMES